MLAALILFNAVASSSAASTQVIQDILPGSPLVDGSRIRPGSWERKLVRSANGEDQILGTMLHTVTATEVRGQPALISVTAITTPRGSGADTAILIARDLAPISHGSLNPGRAMSLVFDGRTVSGSITPTGGPAKPIHHVTPVPTFDSSVMDLVIAALPLRPGFAARIPIFIHEQNGLVWLDITVIAETRLNDGDRSVPVFEVRAQAPIGDTRFFIHTTSREIVRTTFKAPDGAEMRVSR
jgi:hypothetical protein